MDLYLDNNRFKVNNTFSLGKNMYSQWVFPINQCISPLKVKNEYLSQKSKYKKESIQINTLCEHSTSNQVQRVQTIISNLSVSQKDKQKDRKLQSQNYFSNSLYGGFTHKVSKNVAFYKKRLTSLDISNVNELNITSYKNFKIRSLANPCKKKKNNAKQHSINRNKRSKQKLIAILIYDKSRQQNLQKIVNSSPSQNIKTWKLNGENGEIYKNSIGQNSMINTSIIRKNSISPWQNVLDEAI